MDETARYLKSSPPAFQETFVQVDRIVRRTFPSAKAVFQWGMPGWSIQRKHAPDPAEVKGTMDPRFIAILLAARKQGITLHLWNPADYYGLDRSKAELVEAGFKVMRGCLQFNRKQPYPIAVVEKLLKGVRKTAGG